MIKAMKGDSDSDRGRGYVSQGLQEPKDVPVPVPGLFKGALN